MRAPAPTCGVYSDRVCFCPPSSRDHRLDGAGTCFLVAGPVAGGEEANAETYKRKMEAIIVPSTRKDKTGKKRRVDFKIGGITTDSASVMVKARTELAKKYKLMEQGCNFHSTDLACGKIIKNIKWIAEAVSNATKIAKYVKRRARVLAIYTRMRDEENVKVAAAKKASLAKKALKEKEKAEAAAKAARKAARKAERKK